MRDDGTRGPGFAELDVAAEGHQLNQTQVRGKPLSAADGAFSYNPSL